jgi:subtilisin family serine protease
LDKPSAIEGRYIVVFDEAAPAAAASGARVDARALGARILHRYNHALDGFSARLSPRAVEALRSNPHVSFIEADFRVHASDTQSPATWGLDRIDQRNRPLSNSYTYNATGAGVTAYIIDTGIRFSHTQFGGRAVTGFDSVDGGSADDCNGHGTHVAGTVGGSVHGVAKGVRLVGVRVLNCQGSGANSGVIAGVDWVTGNHAAGQPAIANMSLGGGANTALDNAVNNSINDGVSYAVAAGNSNANACNSSPSRVAAAMTVGSTTSSDARSSFSNFGTCLDVFAPGSSITSTWHTSNTATNTISGTSMASPHVAGVAALYLQGSPSASPATVRNAIVNSATPGVLSGVGTGSPNLLLYSLFGTAPPPPPPPPGCSLAESYNGSLSGTGDSDVHPGGTYFYSSSSGTHRGCVRGPSGTDFDLYLYRWNGVGWSIVARGETSSSSEDVTYNGSVGYYYWRVFSYAGSGSYSFGMTRP